MNEDEDYDSFNQFDLDESGSAGPSAGRSHNESKGKTPTTGTLLQFSFVTGKVTILFFINFHNIITKFKATD